MSKKLKFNLGDPKQVEELRSVINNEDPKSDSIFRVCRNMEIRIKNHLFEMRKNDQTIDDLRARIREINIGTNRRDHLSRESGKLKVEILGFEIKGMMKWQRHLKADIKFMNRQKDLLGNGTDKR